MRIKRANILLIVLAIFAIFLYGCSGEKEDALKKAEKLNYFERTIVDVPIQRIIERIPESESLVYQQPQCRILSEKKEKCLCIFTMYTNDNQDELKKRTYNEIAFFHYADSSWEFLPELEGILDGYRIISGTAKDEYSLVFYGFSEQLSETAFFECDMRNGDIRVCLETEEPYKDCMGSDSKNVFAIATASGERLVVFDEEMKTLASFNAEDYIIFQIDESEPVFIQDKKKIMKYTEGKLEESELLFPKVLSGLNENEFFLASGDKDYDYYFGVRDSNGKEDSFVGINSLCGIKAGEIYSIFDFNSMGLESKNIVDVAGNAENGFLIEVFKGFNEYQFVFLKPSDSSNDYSLKNGKTEIKVIGLTEPDELHKVIASFNEVNQNYYVSYTDYISKYENDFDNAKQGIIVALSADKEADVVLLNGLDRDSLIEKGVITDLSGYVNQSNILSEDYFVPSVWNAVNEDGYIYSLYPEYSLYGIFSSEENDLSESASFADYVDSDQITFAGNDSESVLADMITYSGKRIIDCESTTVEGLQGDYFKNMLRILKRQNSNIDFKSLSAEEQVIQNKALLHPSVLEMPYSYFYEKYLFGGVIYCGGISGNSCAIIPGMTNLSLTTYSDKKEGVFEFLDYMFRDDVYHKYFGKYKFPVSKSAWDDWCEKLAADKAYTNRFGEQIQAHKFTYGGNGVNVEFGSMDPEEIKELDEFVESAVYEKPVDSKFVSIIEEEYALYLNGNRDLEKTIDVIENRVDIALKESY